ncbi:Equilibrative nucleoside transporter 1 [Trichinella patagoniensis]|nr:Equilibrative nucleoside transporter 1 [Trichinella patagoniensis]
MCESHVDVKLHISKKRLFLSSEVVDKSETKDTVVMANSTLQRSRGDSKDRFNLIYMLFVLNGIGTLLPWNMFINAQSYFTKFKFADAPEYANHFLACVGICAQVPNLLFNLLNVFLPSKSGIGLRVLGSQAVIAAVLLLSAILPTVDSSNWVDLFFFVTMVSVVLVNSAVGIYQNSLFALSADFPMRYSNAVVIGSNLSGSLTSVLYLISLVVSPSYPVAATVYFVTALLVILCCMFAFQLSCRWNHFFRLHSSLANATTVDNCRLLSTRRSSICTALRAQCKQYYDVFKKLKLQLFNVFFLFLVSLAVFPALSGGVEPISTDSMPLAPRYFSAVCCFLTFNLFALFGNLASAWIHLPLSDRWLSLAISSRVLFVPFFMFCNFLPKQRTLAVLVRNDWLYVTMHALLAFTSGYFSSLLMMRIPRSVEPSKSRVAAMLATFFLVFGIFCGVHVSLFLTYAIEHLGPCMPALETNHTEVLCGQL